MAQSQLVKVVDSTTAGGAPTVTREDAKITDILTTALSTDSAVTGAYGLIQKGLVFAGGMAVNNYMKKGSFNFIKA